VVLQRRTVDDMKVKILQRCNRLFVVIGLFVFAIQLAAGSDISRISGSYQVLSKTELGSQIRVRLLLHLTNDGARQLQIQRLTLWDFSHPEKGGTQTCSIVVHAGGSADTSQEFTLQRPEYELWSRGTRPRLVVEAQSPDGRKTTKVVRLERTNGRKAD
jgi:hypothetical protein